MSAIDRILQDLADAVEADMDSGDDAQEIDRAVLSSLRNPENVKPTAPVVPKAAETVSAPEVGGSVKESPQLKEAEVAKKSAVGGAESVEDIAKEIAACKKCALHSSRTNVVPGQGHKSPDIMFIGEAPGADEDAQGLAFVGRAGKLLTKMIEAMGYTRDEVFIANILKCRPPDNRPPMPDEAAMCMPFLLRQIKVLRPKVIVALGGTAVKGLLKTDEGITKLRGNWKEFEGVPFMPTLHPAYLLRNPNAKHDAWADLQAVLKKLGRKAPAVKK